MTQPIKQSVTFNARPDVIFEALMDSRKHSAFTGAPANINRNAGGRFTCYGGHITGFNIEIKARKSIVQAWRGKDWPQGAWSLVTYSLAAARGGKTKLNFEQVGVPPRRVKGITEGWKKFYWQPLKKMIKDAEATAPRAKKAAGRKTTKPAAAKARRVAAPKKAKAASTRRSAARKTGTGAVRKRASASRRGK
ncbi:MAG: SRPBCC domain-containing protein [Alphaproteobacteria bacterium]